MKKLILASTVLYSLTATEAQAIYRYDFKQKEPTIEINLGALSNLRAEPIAMRPAPVSRGSILAPRGAESSARINATPKPKAIPKAQKPVEGKPWVKEKTPKAAAPKITVSEPKEPTIKVDVPLPPGMEKKLTPQEMRKAAQEKRKAEIDAKRKANQAKRAELQAKRKANQAKQAGMQAKKEANKNAQQKSTQDRVNKLPPLAPPPPPRIGAKTGNKELPTPSFTEPKADFNNTTSAESAALPSLDELFGKDSKSAVSDDDRIIVPPAPKVSAVPAPPPARVPRVGKPEIETVMLKPQALPKISLPSFSEDEPYISVPFAEAEVEFPVSEQAKLIEIVERMNSDSSLVVKVVAFASGTDEQASQAKRTALARALSVRKIFKERNVASDRMIIRPLGNKARNGVPDRVDIFLSKRAGS